MSKTARTDDSAAADEPLLEQEVAALVERLRLNNDHAAVKTVQRLQERLEHTRCWYATRHERLWHWAHAELSEQQKNRYFSIVANGTADVNEPPSYAQQFNIMKYRMEEAERQLAAQRHSVESTAPSPAHGGRDMDQCSSPGEVRSSEGTGRGFEEGSALAHALARQNAMRLDAFGEPRKRFVRISLDNKHCIMHPNEGDGYLEHARNAGDMSDYTVVDVWLSEREFEDLPEHDGF